MKLKTYRSPSKFWLYLSSIMAVFLAVPKIVFAGPIAESLGQILGTIIYFLLIWPFVMLLQLELWILTIVAQFNSWEISGVVTGWVATRDLANMLFIVVLLIIAFATILKIQNYGQKQLLRNLLIMAILVNFSRLIVNIVIDFFQVIMLTFVSSFKDIVAGNITAALGIDSVVNLARDNNQEDLVGDTGQFFQIILGYLLAGIMVVIASIVVMAFIVTLVFRIIMLWILIVLSPLAFLANTFPNTKGYFQQWMSQLTKEVIIGPVLAFFLWLSFNIVGSGNIDEQFKRDANVTDGGESVISPQAGPTQAGEWDNVLNYIVAIAMLIASLRVTSKMGSVAGGMGAKAGAKMQSVISGAARKTGRLAAVGTSGYGGAMKLGGAGLRKVGEGLQRTRSKALRGLGGLAVGTEEYRKRQHEARKPITRAVEKVIMGKKKKQETYADIPGGKYNYYKTKTERGEIIEEVEAKDAMKQFEAAGEADSITKLRQSTAHVHDADSTKKIAAEEGIQGFKGVRGGSLFHDGTIAGTLTNGSQAVLKEVTGFTAAEQDKFLKPKSKTERDFWEKALEKYAATADVNDVVPDMNNTTVNRQSIRYKNAMVNNDTFEALLNAPQFNPNDAVHTDLPARQRAQERRDQMSRDKAGRMTNVDILKLDASKLTFQEISRFASATKATSVAESDDEKAQQMINFQLKSGNTENIDALSKNPVTAQYITKDMVQQSFELQINNASNPQQKREKLAMTNLSYADQAFRDSSGTLDETAFAKFIDTNLDVKEAVKINAAVLKKVLGKLKNKGLKDALQDSGY